MIVFFLMPGQTADDTTLTTRKDPGSPEFVCGVGASAGGLEALEEFFASMASDSGAAFVVVQHLSPNFKSMMHELLAKHTSMEIFVAANGMSVAPNCIYLIPPNKTLEIADGKLVLSARDQTSHVLNLPIDIFFTSLALDFTDRAVAVVLSGTGSDGTRGVRAVKEQGGMVMVQEEGTAKFDGMPKSAIATGLADFELPPCELAERLVAYMAHPIGLVAPRGSELLREGNEADLSTILALLHKQCKTDFTLYKPTSVARRIERRMVVLQLETVPDYARYLLSSPTEVQTLFKELLISVTKFFRDPKAFEVLTTVAIPEVIRAAREQNTPIRIWVPACATGEEAYSLAMIVRQQLDDLDDGRAVKIFATDLDKNALGIAGAGIYPSSIAADVPRHYLERFFVKEEGNAYRVVRRIREMVIFATHDVTTDPPFTKLDLVSLRNLLIYFQPKLQQQVLALLHFALKSQGYMFLGTSESIGELTRSFEQVDSKAKLFRARDGIRHSVPPRVANGRRQHNVPLSPSRKRQRTVAERASTHLIEKHAPAAIVTTDEGELLHSFGEIEEFLKLRAGSPSLSIFDLAVDDLSIALSTAAHRARKNRAEVRYSSVRIRTGTPRESTIDVTVAPLGREKGEPSALVFTFDTSQRPHAGSREFETDESASPSENLVQQLKDTQDELQHTRENLQATIEELETSNEELQSTNEEMLSSNEELQSTNEELHSVNEELFTVNAEYHEKIAELQQLHSQFDALLTYTAVGWLFLDRDLRIVKFTKTVTLDINVIESDIGRPLSDISTALDYDKLISDAGTVAREVDFAIQRRVFSTSDTRREVLVRMVPYGENSSEPEGVVISLIDVTSEQVPDTRSSGYWASGHLANEERS